MTDLFARMAGELAGEACLDKAVRSAEFDTDGAARFIVGFLARHGNTPGEVLTDEAQKHGLKPHDSRAFGPIFARLSRGGQIRCVGYCERRKGHGAAGGRVWGLVRG